MRNSKTRAIRENRVGLVDSCGENVRTHHDRRDVANASLSFGDRDSAAGEKTPAVSAMYPLGAVVEITSGLRKSQRGVLLEVRNSAFFGVPDLAVQFEDGHVRVIRADFVRRMTP